MQSDNLESADSVAIESLTVRQTTVFCAQFFSGHVLCLESGHIQVHHWMLQCAQSGTMVPWNISHPTTSYNTCAQRKVQLEVLTLASSLTR